MNGGQDASQLFGHESPRVGVGVIAQQPAGDSFTLDALHEKKRPAQGLRFVGEPADARNGNTGGRRCLQQQELVTPSGRNGAHRVAPQDQGERLASALHLVVDIERPGLAGGTSRQAVQLGDADAGDAELPGNERADAPLHLLRLHDRQPDLIAPACQRRPGGPQQPPTADPTGGALRLRRVVEK
jgi:hypothetical protein